ncbi:MAG: tetratricopeptide repeat protein [Bacteroidales bacterium]
MKVHFKYESFPAFRSQFLKVLLLLSLILCVFSAKAQQSTDEQLASMFFQDRDYEKAAAIYERLFESKPASYYYTYLIFCYLELNDLKKAEKLVRSQIKKEPKNMKYQVDLGYLYSRLDEGNKAQKQYEDILKNLPPEKNQIIEVANAFLSRRETELAIRTYQNGRQLMGDVYPFSMELAFVYQSVGNITEMVEEYMSYIDYDITKLSYVQDRLQDALATDPDGTKNETFRKTLLRRIQKFPDRTYYSELMIWYSVQQRDFDLALSQAKSLDKRLGEGGQRVYDLARLCVTNNNYNTAEEALRYVISKGSDAPYYRNSRIELLNVSFLKITKNYGHTSEDILRLESDYESALSEMGKVSTSLNLIKNLSHLFAFYSSRATDAITLLEDALKIPGLTPQQLADCKLELGDIYLFTGEVWEATLLYSQVDKAFKNDPLGHEAKFRNARLSYFIGEFSWAKAQLDVLKAATSKLIANDAMDLSLLIGDNLTEDTTGAALKVLSRAELQEYQNKDEMALLALDSIKGMPSGYSLADDVIYRKAKIAMKKGEFLRADSLYAEIVESYPEDILADNALFNLAELNENQLANKSKAMDLYQELISKYPGSLFTTEARKRFRILRGDPVN